MRAKTVSVTGYGVTLQRNKTKRPPRRPPVANEQLASRIARGDSTPAVADEYGLDRTSVYRRVKQPEVRELVLEMRRRMVDRAVGRAADGACEAMDTLIAYMSPGPASEAGAAVAIKAANAVLDQFTKLWQMMVIDQQVAEMMAWRKTVEAQMASREAGPLPMIAEIVPQAEQAKEVAEETPTQLSTWTVEGENDSQV